ncbi:MAG: DUF1837 domain-containing protein [Alistipes sp.]|nr:DUF1837 domain-containing protein [Alistipes sp.]
MVLCFATLIKILLACSKQGTTQKGLCASVLSSINSKYGYELEADESTISKLMSCKLGLSPEEIVNVIQVVDFEDVKSSISASVIPLLDLNALPCSLLALKYIIEQDENIGPDAVIGYKTVDEITQLTNVDIADCITNLLYYTVFGIHNTKGASTIKLVTKDYVKGFQSKADSVSFIQNDRSMPAELSKTLVNSNFNDVFTRVRSKAALELSNRSGIEMYYLDIAESCFDYCELSDYLLSCVGRYVYSRTDVQRLIDKNKIDSIGLRAVKVMNKNGDADEKGSGNELGDMLIYSFLEEVLNAPKILSKVEIRGKQSKSDGIHLLKYNDGKQIKYQLIFGTSSIHDSVYDALDEVFEMLLQIKSGNKNERETVDIALCNNTFDKSTTELLKTILIPQKGKPKIPMAFGIFVGYSIGIVNNNNDEFFMEVQNKMKNDIEEVIPYISHKVYDMGLEAYSYYLYFLPMNHAEQDKKAIMEELMN